MDCELSEVNWICPYFFFKKKKSPVGKEDGAGKTRVLASEAEV